MKNKFLAILISSAIALPLIPSAFADEVTIYDSVKYTNTCETEADGFTLTEGAPDGSNYYSYTGTEGMFRIGGLGADTSEDYMWEADVRFDANSAGFTVQGTEKNKTVNTCIRRYDETDGTAMLAVQTGGNKFEKYTEIDTESWYHIQLIGQYSTTSSLYMVVYKWENGKMTLVGEYDSINKRNNGTASYISVESNTSIDNVQITKLGADTLTVTTVPEGVTEINASSSVAMQLSAARNGRYINNPAVEWKVFENGSEITDGSVSVSSSGVVCALADCAEKDIVVKAISTETGNAEGSYDLHINAVDFDNEKFDKLYLTAENDYVRPDKPLALTVLATNDGEAVTLEDGDVVWKIYDKNNLQELGNRYITITDDCLYVTDDVLQQDIMVRAESVSGVVFSYIPVTVKENTTDLILASDSGEDTNNSGISSPSWDGSHFYNSAISTVMAETDSITEEIIISADLKFAEENSGLLLRGGNYIGGQVARQGNSLGTIGSGNRFTTICTGDAESWYNIVINGDFNPDSYGALISIYKYNDDGSKNAVITNETLDLRTMASTLAAFERVEVSAGTYIDNVQVVKLMPDTLTLSLPSAAAGTAVQAEYTLLRQGKEITDFSDTVLEWELYNEDNTAPIEDVLVTVDDHGKITIDPTTDNRTVYLRVTTENGISAAAPLNITKTDIFTVTGVGMNADRTAVTKIKADKNVDYSGNVVFIVMAYDKNGILADVAIKTIEDNSLIRGENIIDIDDVTIPEEFSEIKVMAWTGL